MEFLHKFFREMWRGSQEDPFITKLIIIENYLIYPILSGCRADASNLVDEAPKLRFGTFKEQWKKHIWGERAVLGTGAGKARAR